MLVCSNLDPYNVYQQCYEQDHQVFGSAASRHKPWKVMEYHQLKNIHTVMKRSANADTKPGYRPSLNQLVRNNATRLTLPLEAPSLPWMPAA